jgi:hypothetical protein
MKVPISIEYELPQPITSRAKTRVTSEVVIPDLLLAVVKILADRRCAEKGFVSRRGTQS